MAVDVEIPQRVRGLLGPPFADHPSELQRSATSGQLGQFAARRLHLRRPIQAQDTTELPGRMSGASLDALDPQQGHHAEGQQHRRQAEVAVLPGAINVLSHLDEPLPEEGRQCHQHTRVGD